MSKTVRNNPTGEIRAEVTMGERYLKERDQSGALYLSHILNGLVSRDQMRFISKRLSLPTSPTKGHQVNAICAYGRSMALAGERASFVRTIKTALEECWDDEYVYGVRYSLGFSEDLTKAEVLDRVLDDIHI